MARTALLSLLPAALIFSGWRRLEDPALSGELFLASVLAVAVALIPRRAVRSVAGAVALLSVLAAGFGVSPLDARPFDADHDFFGPLLARFGGGVIDFYEVALPLDPGEHGRMHGVLVLAVFAFTLLAALAIATRRPTLAAAATLTGAAWPVALVPEDASTTRGALMLVAALILLAGTRPAASRGSGQALAVGSAVVLAAAVAVSSPSVAKGGFLNWQQWEPYTREAKPVSVRYVWDANYDGIVFPKRPTTVLKIKAHRRSPYWRATTLDVFLDDVWREDAQLLEPVRGAGLDSLVNDPLLPAAARDAENWLKQEVTVEALQDTHLVGASVPVAFEEGRAGGYSPGVAHVGRLERGQTYSVWSYAAQPRPAQLARSRPEYPDTLLFDSSFLAVGGFYGTPPFGTPGRETTIREMFGQDPELAQYAPLYRQARQVVGRPRNPYAAAVALEAWFRTGGDFTYDERPPTGTAAPPLVAFATGHRRGYCQHFAGAMALMLRYLGIPARVAAGFTTGRFDQDEREWTVADTNAHTWVEVWFAGYGWLPFDPTPGRGRLRAPYTASSLFFDADGATAAFAGVAVAALGLDVLRNRLGGSASSPDDRLRGPDPGFTGDVAGGTTTTAGDDGRDLRVLGLLLLGAAGLLTVLWAAKTARRRARYVNTDPRGVAAAVRAELVDYLADQRLHIRSSATTDELVADLQERLRVDGERLADALGAARYGPSREAGRAARTARRELRSVLRAVRRRLSKTARLRGLLSLRSLGFRSA